MASTGVGYTIASDGNNVNLNRSNATQNVAPTSSEVPSPDNGDTTTVRLNNGIVEHWSYIAGTWSLIYTQIPTIFRFGLVAPSFVAATDSVNSTYVRTTDGAVPNATGSNIVDEWVLDNTNVWRIVSKAKDAVVTVTGVTLPVTFPVTTFPGTPVFSPNTPQDTTVVYQLTDGTLASWNGTQYIAAVLTEKDFWRSTSGTILPDGTNDLTENIGRIGNMALGHYIPLARLHTYQATGSGIPVSGTANTPLARFHVSNGVLDIINDTNAPYGYGVQSKDVNANTSLPLLLNPMGGNVGVKIINPTSTIHVDGSEAGAITVVTTTTTLNATHHKIVANNGATTITLTLPDALTCIGREYIISRAAGSTGILNVVGAGGNQIQAYAGTVGATTSIGIHSVTGAGLKHSFTAVNLAGVGTWMRV